MPSLVSFATSLLTSSLPHIFLANSRTHDPDSSVSRYRSIPVLESLELTTTFLATFLLPLTSLATWQDWGERWARRSEYISIFNSLSLDEKREQRGGSPARFYPTSVSSSDFERRVLMLSSSPARFHAAVKHYLEQLEITCYNSPLPLRLVRRPFPPPLQPP